MVEYHTGEKKVVTEPCLIDEAYGILSMPTDEELKDIKTIQEKINYVNM